MHSEPSSRIFKMIRAVLCLLAAAPVARSFCLPAAPSTRLRAPAARSGRVASETPGMYWPPLTSQPWVDRQAKLLLLRFGDAWESKNVKSAAYDSLLLSPSAPRLLEAALALVDAAAESRLAKKRWPFRLPSRRAALGCYGRVLDSLVAEGCDVSQGFEVYGDCRRSLLLDVLRELKDADGPSGIYALEDVFRARREAA